MLQLLLIMGIEKLAHVDLDSIFYDLSRNPTSIFFFEKRLLITQYVAAIRHNSGQFCMMLSRPSEPKVLAAQETLATGMLSLREG